MIPDQRIDLHSAFCWDCDNCGQENFCRGIEGDFDESALKEAIKSQDDCRVDAHLETEAWTEEDNDFLAEYLIQKIVLAPKLVTCARCNSRYLSHIVCDEDDEE